MDIVEYAGLTREAAALIEKFRSSPTDTKSDIIVRTLGAISPAEDVPRRYLDLGQGARLIVGETVTLFLSEESKRKRQAEALAVVGEDGLYFEGKRVRPSKGSYLQPVMHAVQKRLNHRNDEGEIISLSAWLKWHVERDGKLIPVFKLKDPALAHTRTRNLVSPVSVEELI